MKNARTWIIILIASAAAGILAIQSLRNANEPPPSHPTATVTATIAPLIAASRSAVPYGQCTYAWATYGLPELSKKLELAVQTLDPSATARAQVLGEDCIYLDGQKVFTARQTDFHVRLPVTGLTNEDAMGNWIAQVMRLVMQLRPEDVQGPQPGNVEFTFIKTEAEQVHLSIPIYSYMEISQGKTGIEIFRYYHIPPTSPT